MGFEFGRLQIWMNKFRQKGNITDKDFMIHILNNLPEEYNVIPDGLENCLTATRDDVLAIDAICKKLNCQTEKIKSKKDEKCKKRA